MTVAEALEKLLPSYEGYYDVKRENVLHPFAAEAVFISHQEQYFLVHSAKLSDIDSTEHIYFATEQNLSLQRLQELSKDAWENGIKNVQPYYGHRNSDITVIVICENSEPDVFKNCKKIKYSKTYKFMLHGWSNFKLAVVCLSSGKAASNWQGGDLKTFLLKALKKAGAVK